MSDVESLYRAILAAPGDDTVRLVYADALEESGDEATAAFVRAQVELARLPFYDAKQIEWHHFATGADPNWIWDEVLPEGIEWAQRPYRRGLPGAVRGDAEMLLRGADELFARFPLESVEFGILRVSDAGALAECAWLSRVRELNLRIGVGAQAVARLFDSPHLTALTDLSVGSELSTPPALAAVVNGPVFPRLRALTVRNDQRGGGTVAGELVRYRGPARLERLDITGNRLAAEPLAPLLAAPVLARVAELDLTDNHLGAPGCAVLAFAPLTHLCALNLARTRPTDAGAAALGAAPFLPTLRALSLSDNNLTSESAAALAAAPLHGLRSLNLFGNRVGDRGAEELARSAALSGLLELDLSQCRVGDAGALALAESPHLGGLLFLNLHGEPLGPRAADALRDRFGPRARFKAE
jgi:uncharacterized protein (TIGR02996 family)